MMYSVMVYEINRQKKIINFVESLYSGNRIHVRADEISEKPGKLKGRFSVFDVYIDQENEGVKVTPGDYVYGKVKRLRSGDGFPRVMLKPTKLVEESKYKKFRNVIFGN